MRRFGWIGVGSSALLVSVAAILLSQRPSARVELAYGGELRVLKVSLGTSHVFSTEPLWKQGLRFVLLPSWEKPLGPFQGERFKTRDESLVVWVSRIAPAGGAFTGGAFGDAGTVFSDGTVVGGQLRQFRGNTYRLQFDCFPRDQREVALQLRYGAMVKFSVTNPRPVLPVHWKSPPLPQTNQSSAAEIVLSEARRDSRPGFAGQTSFTLNGRALGKGTISWLGWRVTAFDSLGNQFQGRWTWAVDQPLPTVTLPYTPNSTSKLVVEAQECVAAGFIADSIPGAVQSLPVSLRAREFGFQTIAILGPGSYRLVSGGAVLRNDEAGEVPDEPSLTFSRELQGTNSVVELESRFGGVLCLVDPSVMLSPPTFQMRVRERAELKPGGFVWPPGVETTSTKPPGSRQWAMFFPVRNMIVTTNLEVEIVATHPPMDFFVAVPKP